MKSITVFVMLDACRPDYIAKETTPFLYRLASKGYISPIQPTFGFEPDAAYLAGLFPDQADGGAQFWYAPDQSPFRLSRFFPRGLNNLPDIAQKVIRKLIVKLTRSTSPNLSTARIPFHLINQFGLPMKFNLDHPDFCSYPTIFDLLRNNNQKYLFHAAPKFRVTMAAALKRANKSLFPPNKFAFFHIGNLDGTGHKFGPDSKEIKKELLKVDQGLETLFRLSEKRFDKVNFVIMGDHGMVRVENHLDIENLLQYLPLKSGKDYLCFLDSTMARFWFFNNLAKEKITNALSFIKEGRVLNKKQIDRYHLNYTHNRFGDLIFLVDPGTLIFPNYFQNRAPVKGMHGYGPESIGQQAIFIINSSEINPEQHEKPVNMRQVFPTLCDLLTINKPDSCGLESLVTKL